MYSRVRTLCIHFPLSLFEWLVVAFLFFFFPDESSVDEKSLVFYPELLNAREFSLHILQALYTQGSPPSINFASRSAHTSCSTSNRTLARNAEMFFYSPLLNAKELNRHIWQARCRHGPEQYSHIFPQIRRLRFRPYATFFASTSDHTLARTAARERLYICKHCGIGFSSVTFLSGHTGERLYICKHCDSKHQI